MLFRSGEGPYSRQDRARALALAILRPATDYPARRNALMITAHVIWGAALGVLTAQVTDGETRKSAG